MLDGVTSAMDCRANILVFTYLLTALSNRLLCSPLNTPDRLVSDLETTCSVPAAHKGQNAKLTCDFKTNVSGIDVMVLYHGWDRNASGKTIFECYKDNADRRHCEPTENLYDLQSSVSHQTTLLFVADKSMEGFYSCNIPGDQHPSLPCAFRLAPEAETRMEVKAGAIAGGIVGLLLVASIAAIFVLRRNRRSHDNHDTADGSESPISGRGVNRRRPGGFQRVCSSCCIRPLSGNSHDASLTTPMTKSPTDAENVTPAQRCVDSGIDSLQYPSYIERITYSSASSTGRESIPIAPEVNSDNTLTSSAAQTILRPFVDAMEKLRREVLGPTPPTPTSAAAEYDCEPKEMSNVDRILTKIDSDSEDTADKVAKPRTRKTPPSDDIESTEAPPASPQASEWPPLHKLQDQKVWIERRLLPYVSCTDFPRTSQEANKQLVELLTVQQSIQCRLDDLKNLPSGRCSFDVSQLQDVIDKLEYAEKQVGTRQKALKELLNNLVKAEHVVHNYIHKMNRVARPAE